MILLCPRYKRVAGMLLFFLFSVTRRESLLGGINYRALWKIGSVKAERTPQSLGQASEKRVCPCGPPGERAPGYFHYKLPFGVLKQLICVIQSQSQVQDYSNLLTLSNPWGH